jgi:ribonuclease HII
LSVFRPDHPLRPEIRWPALPAAGRLPFRYVPHALIRSHIPEGLAENWSRCHAPVMARSDSPTLFDLPLRPDFSVEARLLAKGCRAIAGTDEAGRGPLAGPVVAAAVILDPGHIPPGLDDSKRMSAQERETAFSLILSEATAVALCSMPAEAIDASDIRKASLEAMRRAVAALSVAADYVLADGRDVPPGLGCAATALIKGDQRSVSIAAASIVAKVMRDRMMAVSGSQHPVFGFEAHAGYGTARHMRSLSVNGPITRLHRFSFAPLRKG